MARWGLVIVAIYALVALLTPLLVSLGVLPDVNTGLSNPIYDPPTWSHWCGTDRLGRDVCVRTMAGSGVALQVVLLAVGVALLVGVPLGMVSGYLGGAVDRVLVLLMDTLYTLPVLLLSVVLAFLLGKGIPNAAAALCVVYVPQYFRVVRNQTAQVKSELFIEAATSLGAGPLWILRRYLFRNVITSVPVLLTLNAAAALCVVYVPQYFRVVRNQTASVKAELFVEAAQSLGAGPVWIMRKYLFRNVITSVPVVLTMNAADSVLMLGSLGFLGLGLPAVVPEWGAELKQALTALPTGIWWTALYPGVAMFILVLALSFIGEGLDAWVSGDEARP